MAMIVAHRLRGPVGVVHLLALVGAAPNAIACQSKQFSALESFRAGIPASILLVLVMAVFVWDIWPWMGMQVTL